MLSFRKFEVYSQTPDHHHFCYSCSHTGWLMMRKFVKLVFKRQKNENCGESTKSTFITVIFIHNKTIITNKFLSYMKTTGNICTTIVFKWTKEEVGHPLLTGWYKNILVDHWSITNVQEIFRRKCSLMFVFSFQRRKSPMSTGHL